MKEEWRDVKGYEGFYQVSNIGRVKRVKYWNHHKNDWSYINRIMKPTDNGNGYKIVGLKVQGKKTNHYVHRLVAEVFLHHPLGKDYINHLDHDRSNNKTDNLEWCTQKENVEYSKHLMKGFRDVPPCKSGERYIRIINGKYNVYIKKKLYGTFNELSDAIRRRDFILDVLYGYQIRGDKNENVEISTC